MGGCGSPFHFLLVFSLVTSSPEMSVMCPVKCFQKIHFTQFGTTKHLSWMGSLNFLLSAVQIQIADPSDDPELGGVTDAPKGCAATH